MLHNTADVSMASGVAKIVATCLGALDQELTQLSSCSTSEHPDQLDPAQLGLMTSASQISSYQLTRILMTTTTV